MLVDKFEIFLALFAGLILLVMGFIYNFTLPDILLRLLIVLVIFYIIGLIVKTYLRKRIFFETEVETEIEAEENSYDDGGEQVLVQTNEMRDNAENQPTLQ